MVAKRYKAFQRTEMAAAKNDNDVVPSWSGKACDLPEYGFKVKLYRLGTKAIDRETCGPRLIKALQKNEEA